MTNIHKLWEYKEYINVNGMMLGNELISRLQNSLTLLQVENHFSQMQYWGQIYAIDADYHIAVGITHDAINERKYFYTHDFLFWSLLPKAKRKYKHLSLLTTFPFRGDPALKIKVLDESLDPKDPDRCKEMKEESRLAATISNICEEAEVCARGQLIKQPDGTIVINSNYYGLTAAEAKLQKSYYHIRPAQHRWNTNLLTRPDYNYSMDFLDSIDQDIPTGSWDLSVEQGGTVIYLKCLYWPGMSYFHKVRTPESGFLYVGNGHKNLDVPFDLSF
ncbi:radial spoke head protein 9 homolog [Pectinophora gossypiella]|uniref:radial spoke head protein 9 homolog n=1 Tax=Pectinophora gossypiella TaxID=13191 RepID=UPI00214F1A1A|nr:radial spoke head protein 9 homolog [Pectinophora gossypiella]